MILFGSLAMLLYPLCRDLGEKMPLLFPVSLMVFVLTVG